MKNLIILMVLTAFPCFGAQIKLYTDYPNSDPVASDFLLFQRGGSYINASQSQALAQWFNSPTFTGNGSIAGSFNIGGNATVSGTLNVGGAIITGVTYYGDGSGLSNVASQVYLKRENDNGTNESFWGSTFFEEVDALNFYPTNLFTGYTNAQYTATDGNGRLIAGTGLPATNVLLVAGSNIAFSTNGDGSITIASSGTITITTVTNNTFVNTNVLIVTSNSFINNSYITNLYTEINTNNTFVNTNIFISQSNAYFNYTTYINTNFSTNLYFVSGKGNTLIVTNVAVYGTQTNFNIAASSAVITKSDQVLTNAPNAHGVFTNSATGPPSFGLLQNTELQNSSITVQGSAVALGGSTLAAGSSPAFTGINITNNNYIIQTNNGGGAAMVGGANGTAATLYLTNITAATTLASFTWPTTVASGIKMYVTCSGGTDRILTFPNGCTGAGLGTPPAVTITNAKAAYFDVICIPGVTTNVFWSPVF